MKESQKVNEKVITKIGNEGTIPLELDVKRHELSLTRGK